MLRILGSALIAAALAAPAYADIVPYQARLTIEALDDPFNPLRTNPQATEPCTGIDPALNSHGWMYCGLAVGETYTARFVTDDIGTPLDGGAITDFHFEANRILIDSASPGFTIGTLGGGPLFSCCVDNRRLGLESNGIWRFSDFFSGSFLFGHYEVSRVPEPGTLAIVALGLLAGWLARRGVSTGGSGS